MYETLVYIIQVRGCVATLLLLTNAKRAGDVRRMRVDEVARAVVPDGGGFAEVCIAAHKEARSGKTCSFFLDRASLAMLQGYVRLCVPASSEHVFLTRKGERMRATVSIRVQYYYVVLCVSMYN